MKRGTSYPNSGGMKDFHSGLDFPDYPVVGVSWSLWITRVKLIVVLSPARHKQQGQRGVCPKTNKMCSHQINRTSMRTSPAFIYYSKQFESTHETIGQKGYPRDSNALQPLIPCFLQIMIAKLRFWDGLLAMVHRHNLVYLSPVHRPMNNLQNNLPILWRGDLQIAPRDKSFSRRVWRPAGHNIEPLQLVCAWRTFSSVTVHSNQSVASTPYLIN